MLLYGNEAFIKISNDINSVGKRFSKKDDSKFSYYDEKEKSEQLSLHKRQRVPEPNKAYTRKRIAKATILETEKPKKIRSKRSPRKSIECAKAQNQKIRVKTRRRSSCQRVKKIDTNVINRYQYNSTNYTYTQKHHVRRAHY
jgi:hypothetical protein